MKYIYIAIIVFVILAAWTQGSQAHGVGVSLEKIVDEYRVDIGQDPPTLEAQSSSLFDFDLIIEETGERVDFGDIWVRIVEGKKTVFASGIHKPDFGNATMVYTFPEGGEYELNVRFQNQGNKIAEASFPLIVQSTPSAAGSAISFLWLIIGVVVGIIGGFLLASILNIGKKKNGNTGP